MDGPKKNRLNIDVDGLATKNVKRRKKRDLNETIYYEINGKQVPVFTPEFLEDNRLVESELRKLRKLNNDFEEHNSVLVKYIDDLKTSCDQLGKELKELTEYRDLFKGKFNLFRSDYQEE